MGGWVGRWLGGSGCMCALVSACACESGGASVRCVCVRTACVRVVRARVCVVSARLRRRRRVHGCVRACVGTHVSFACLCRTCLCACVHLCVRVSTRPSRWGCFTLMTRLPHFLVLNFQTSPNSATRDSAHQATAGR